MHPQVKRTWNPVTAGILDIVSGVYIGVLLARGLLDFAAFLNDEAGKMENILFPLTAIFASAFMIFTAFCLAASASLAITGGVFAVRRKVYGLALTGSIAVFVTSLLAPFAPFIQVHPIAWIIASILGLAAIILISLSKSEFK